LGKEFVREDRQQHNGGVEIAQPRIMGKIWKTRKEKKRKETYPKIKREEKKDWRPKI